MSENKESGEVAEWLNAAVLKTADPREGSVGSNPTLSENQSNCIEDCLELKLMLIQ